MSDLGDALHGIWTLLDMLGSLVRKVFRGNRTAFKREWRSRDNAWLGVLTVIVLGLLVLFLVGCEGSLPEPSTDDDLRVGGHTFVSLPKASDPCDPKTMPAYQNATPLARKILSGEEFSLANDTEALALLDSMLFASKPVVRSFYFLVVTKSLSRSDGYYSEGVGYWGTEHLIQHPKEFLEAWSECISMNEQRKWAWYLAAEENIGSEGYPTKMVMRDYVHRLDSLTKDLPGSLLNAKSSLLNAVDSIYRELAKDDRPVSTSNEGY